MCKVTFHDVSQGCGEGNEAALLGETALAGGTLRILFAPFIEPNLRPAPPLSPAAELLSATSNVRLPLNSCPPVSSQPNVVEIPVSAAAMHWSGAGCPALPPLSPLPRPPQTTGFESKIHFEERFTFSSSLGRL